MQTTREGKGCYRINQRYRIERMANGEWVAQLPRDLDNPRDGLLWESPAHRTMESATQAVSCHLRVTKRAEAARGVAREDLLYFASILAKQASYIEQQAPIMGTPYHQGLVTQEIHACTQQLRASAKTMMQEACLINIANE